MKTIKLHDKEFERYIPAKVIQNRILELAKIINNDLAGRTPLFIGVLNGAFLFCADLFKNISIECEISFIKVSSYDGIKKEGIKTLVGLDESVKGRDIIFVEDIVDSGATALFLNDEIQKFQPKSVLWASLLLKPKALQHDITVTYLGFEVPNEFLVGYGMDYRGLGRNLNDLYVIKNEPIIN